MIKSIKVIKAEFIKMHKNYFHSLSIYFTLLIWPILIFFNTYYTYFSFNFETLKKLGIYDKNSLLMFLIIGALGLNCFFSMVQSAWQMSYERQNGTLEIIFMSPVNKVVMIYGRSLGSFIENVWLFFIFSIFLILYSNSFSIYLIIKIISSFLILTISSTIWGGLMNSIFLFSRDATFLFNIIDSPMDLFSGCRMPIESFPSWGKVISGIFPLTYCLKIMRNIFINKGIDFYFSDIIKLCIVLTVMIIVTIIITYLAEKNNRETGSMSFY